MLHRNIKNMIVAVDLSNYSKKVVQEAKALSLKLKIKPIYVFVFQDVEIFDGRFDVTREAVARYHEKEIIKKYDLKKTELILVKFGKPADEIIATAKMFKDPMILAGHRGHSSLVRLFMGSTAERLALQSPFPVWIHRGERIVLPKKILVPCDLTSRSEHTIAEVSSLNKTLKGSLELYHVMQEPTPIMDFQAYSLVYEEIKKADDLSVKAFKKKHPKLKTVREAGEVVTRIQQHSKGFDVIALSPRNKGQKSAFFGSVTAKLVRSGDKPVFVIP